ncbi:unnamed protein product [Rhizopus stolonifer]
MFSTATADDVIKEAEERVKTYFEQGNEWKRRASSITLEKTELENKMRDLSKHYKAQNATLIDEIGRLQKLLAKKSNDDDDDEDSQEELENIRRLKDNLQRSLNSAELENPNWPLS